MTLHQFAIFSAIAKRGNLTKAALDLRMSQPAISHQMKQLQERYGAPLYARTPFGIELTPAGEKLLIAIGPILEMVRKLRSGPESDATCKAEREVLRVGGIESVSASLLPAVLARFKRRHENAEIDFRTRTSEHLERLLLNQTMDLAVTGREAPCEALICEPLRKEKVAMFVLADHPLAKRSNVRLTDILAEPLIVRGGRGGEGVTDCALLQLRELGQPIHISMRCDGPTAIKAAVREKMGVGVLFADSIKAEVQRREFKILEVRGLELEGRSYIVYLKNKPLNSLAREFLEMLRRAAIKYQSERQLSAAGPSPCALQRSYPARVFLSSV